ncbi:MAG: hypothetical protein BKP49_05395 [Treponema sp. CETP13]|nr:MAG: hypothetical protein BKP49_05395 [Treponema sp. CETP13]
MIGTTEIVVIALVILVLFGASAIPKFAKSLGEAKKEYKNATADDEPKEAAKKVETAKDDKKEESK